MFDGNFRANVDKGFAPIAKKLQKLSVSPDFLTLVGVLMAAGCAAAIAFGQFQLAVVLLILTGLSDALDGAVAKAAGSASLRGAYFDSVADRLSDALLFGGVAWYLARQGHTALILLPFGLYVAASLVSYQRAKAESLGFQAKGGLMERAERFVVLGFGLFFSSILIPVLWVMFGLTVVTALGRFRKVWVQASAKQVREPKQRRRTRRRSQVRKSNKLKDRARAFQTKQSRKSS